MVIRDKFEIEDVASIDYSRWLQQVVGWDAILPFFILLSSAVMAKTFERSPADVIFLCGLPAAGFWIRWTFGYRHIKSNACGNVLRGFQTFALVVGLCGLCIVDFFSALLAFVDDGNAPSDDSINITVVCVAGYLAYLMLAIFAMYPGRVRDLRLTDRLPERFGGRF